MYPRCNIQWELWLQEVRFHPFKVVSRNLVIFHLNISGELFPGLHVAIFSKVCTSYICSYLWAVYPWRSISAVMSAFRFPWNGNTRSMIFLHDWAHILPVKIFCTISLITVLIGKYSSIESSYLGKKTVTIATYFFGGGLL